MSRYIEVFQVYAGSNGEATIALYQALKTCGVEGELAVNVFRAQKASERAKKYRGGRGGQSYRAMAYDKKQWSLSNLAHSLMIWGPVLHFPWGWAVDPKQEMHKHVLYIDLPTGQVSWHGGARGVGPDYPGRWDGAVGMAPDRICRWVAQVLDAQPEAVR